MRAEKAFYLALESVDIVIFGSTVTLDAHDLIQRSSPAMLIRNHAGSAEAFSEWFISEVTDFHSSREKLSVYRSYCERYHGFLFQSYDQCRESIRILEVDKNKGYVLPPTTQENAVLRSLQSQSPYKSQRRAVVVVGSMQSRKGPCLALEAFHQLSYKLPDVDIHFVGKETSVAYMAEIYNFVTTLGLQERVYFHDHRSDYLRYMAHADILVQSSLAEGVSRVLREAMVLRLPIVSFSIIGTAELLDGESDAYLVEPGDLYGLSGEMVRALQDRSESQRRAANAFLKYCLYHSHAAYADGVRQTVWHFYNLKNNAL